jgi:two-component system chemotaxis response regulator CheY
VEGVSVILASIDRIKQILAGLDRDGTEPRGSDARPDRPAANARFVRSQSVRRRRLIDKPRKKRMKHCLVVDDSAVIRKVARRILEELRFTASEAENGRDALDQCRMSMPDAVLLDWNMPVVDGIAFLVALRKEQGGNAPKVIFCTTENDVEHITRAISAGANEYIMKPFDRDIIEAKFHEVGLL